MKGGDVSKYSCKKYIGGRGRYGGGTRIWNRRQLRSGNAQSSSILQPIPKHVGMVARSTNFSSALMYDSRCTNNETHQHQTHSSLASIPATGWNNVGCLCRQLDRGESVLLLLLDLTAALDKLNFDLLTHRLTNAEVQGVALQCLSSFLQGWGQRVALGERVSDRHPLVCGVLQGAAISPKILPIYVPLLSRHRVLWLGVFKMGAQASHSGQGTINTGTICQECGCSSGYHLKYGGPGHENCQAGIFLIYTKQSNWSLSYHTLTLPHNAFTGHLQILFLSVYLCPWGLVAIYLKDCLT